MSTGKSNYFLSTELGQLLIPGPVELNWSLSIQRERPYNTMLRHPVSSALNSQESSGKRMLLINAWTGLLLFKLSRCSQAVWERLRLPGQPTKHA